MIRKLLIQIKFFIVGLINLTFRIMPFFSLRKILLQLLGSKIGRETYIHRNIRFFDLGKIIVGDNTTINSRTYLDARRTIVIGNNVMIGHDCKIYTLGHDINDPLFPTKGSSVIIEDDVVIFSNVLIMPGVKISKGAVIYSGSVITKDVIRYSVMGGNPAVKISERNNNIGYKLKYNFWLSL